MLLLEKGLAYPAFYTSLPCELRDVLAAATVQSRNNHEQMWADAVPTNQEVLIPDIETLEMLTLWPKLFRRLSSYFSAGYQNLDAFDAWLRADPVNRDDRLILPNRELGNMHDIVVASGSILRMLYQPEDLVVLPDGAVAIPPCTQKPEIKRYAIRIMAALANPIGTETGNESVTLLNASAAAIDLTDWSIRDKVNGKQLLQGILGAGITQRVVFSGGVRLGNNGDTISLFNAADELMHQVSYTKKQAQEEGWSILF